MIEAAAGHTSSRQVVGRGEGGGGWDRDGGLEIGVGVGTGWVGVEGLEIGRGCGVGYGKRGKRWG